MVGGGGCCWLLRRPDVVATALLLLASPLPPLARAQLFKDVRLTEVASGLARDLADLRPKVWSNDSHAPGCDLPARSGRLSGVCVDDVQALRSELKFCGPSIQYRACVPAQQPLWPTWTASQKDTELSRLFKDLVEARLAKEMNVTPDTYVEMHLMSNAPCVAHLRNVLCWYNFPKCNDQNVSLPLCRSSCDQYYKKCKYEANETDGLHDACRPETVRQSGLWQGEMPGPDQVLEEDTEVCRSTEAAVDAITEAEAAATPWLLKPQGLSVVGFSFLAFFALVFYFLVPEGLQKYAWWWLKGIWMKPVHLWRRLPTLHGTTVLVFMIITFLVLLIWGLVRRLSAGGGFKRFEGMTNAGKVEFGTGLSNQAKELASNVYSTAASLTDAIEAQTGANFSNLSMSDFIGKNASAEDFIPSEATWGLQTHRKLTTQQMRQLLASCSCTGAAAAGAVPSLAASLLLPSAAALLLTTAAVPAPAPAPPADAAERRDGGLVGGGGH